MATTAVYWRIDDEVIQRINAIHERTSLSRAKIANELVRRALKMAPPERLSDIIDNLDSTEETP